MKQGTGDDPFEEPDEDDEQSELSDPQSGQEAVTVDSDQATEPAADQRGSLNRSNGAQESATGDDNIPWVLRRSSVKEDRQNVKQFFLREETAAAERTFRNEVENLLGKDVYTLDLREAAYLVAQEHPEEVAEQLREWGYDYL